MRHLVGTTSKKQRNNKTMGNGRIDHNVEKYFKCFHGFEYSGSAHINEFAWFWQQEFLIEALEKRTLIRFVPNIELKNQVSASGRYRTTENIRPLVAVGKTGH